MSDDQHEDQAAGGADPLAALGRQIAEQLDKQLGGAQINPAMVTALAGDLRAVDEKVDAMGADVAQLGALAPKVQKLSETVEHLGSVVETLEGTPPQALADWLTLGPDEAEERWREIAYWVQHTLVPGYGITRGLLPDCWPMHRPVLVTLSWMYATYRQAYAPRANPNLAAEWSTRWLRDGLDNISHPDRNRRPAAAIREEKCRHRPDAVGVHMMTIDNQRDLEAQQRAESAASKRAEGAASKRAEGAASKRAEGAASMSPSEMSRHLAQAQARGSRGEARSNEPVEDPIVAAGQQPASRRWWDGYWKKAREKDVAWRRERAASEEDAAR